MSIVEQYKVDTINRCTIFSWKEAHQTGNSLEGDCVADLRLAEVLPGHVTYSDSLNIFTLKNIFSKWF
jgi:hypothetical protein